MTMVLAGEYSPANTLDRKEEDGIEESIWSTNAGDRRILLGYKHCK